MKVIVFTILCFLSAQLKAQTCTIEFKINNAGFQVEGSIKAGKTEINFNPDRLESSSIVAEAETATIKTGIALRDKHLKKSDYFDVLQFPIISMKSTAFEKTGKDEFVGYFDLTIKKITKQVKVSFTVKIENGSSVYIGDFKLNRLDYQIGEKSLILDETVRVHLLVNN
jgi:polyisoprenoid-binding protein YceI